LPKKSSYSGTGIGGSYTDTKELIPMKFKEAMSGPKKDEWLKAVEKEYQFMVNMRHSGSSQK
jgi:hypothetical protein